MKEKLTIVDYAIYAFLIVFSFMALYPFLFVLAGSFNVGSDYMRGGIYFFPRQFTLLNYSAVFYDRRLYFGFENTVLRTVIGTTTSVFFTAMVAYAMARKKLMMRGFYSWINIIPMFFGGGLIPYFLLLKNLSLINNFWVYIIPGLYSIFNMIIMQAFFREIPEEIHESAHIDGAGEFRIFLTLIIPLSPSILATVALWNAVGHWNSFFDSMIFTTKQELMTLQLFLMRVIKEASIASSQGSDKIPPMVKREITVQTVRLAAIVITMVPILVVYPFLQKYFVTGVMVGSIKA